MRRHELALQKRSPMPLFRDRGSGPAVGRGNEPPPPPPTPKSSDLFSHDDPKNRNATCLPSLQPFHLPLSLPFLLSAKLFPFLLPPPPLPGVYGSRDDTLRTHGLRVPSAVTLPRPSRNRSNEAGQGRVLRHHYLKLKLVPRVHPRGPR